MSRRQATLSSRQTSVHCRRHIQYFWRGLASWNGSTSSSSGKLPRARSPAFTNTLVVYLPGFCPSGISISNRNRWDSPEDISTGASSLLSSIGSSPTHSSGTKGISFVVMMPPRAPRSGAANWNKSRFVAGMLCPSSDRKSPHSTVTSDSSRNACTEKATGSRSSAQARVFSGAESERSGKKSCQGKITFIQGDAASRHSVFPVGRHTAKSDISTPSPVLSTSSCRVF